MKITFMGAGSTVFAKNVLGDVMLTPSLRECEIALYDIDPKRLDESFSMLENLNQNCNAGRANICRYTRDMRKDALRGADFVINAIQVGGYEPCTVTDFEIPKKYGLRQTIGDTLGIGGIFRGLRTIPVMLEFAREMEEVCPGAWFLNYTNPMAIVTGAVQRATGIKTVGLCHSVQSCTNELFSSVGMDKVGVGEKIAGINHMAWLLEVTRDGHDIYPEIKRKSLELGKHKDMVRHKIMHTFGYYVTESSEHNAEYLPYFIKSKYPELIDDLNIPLDEYPRRCINQIQRWNETGKELTENKNLTHERTTEYASYIMESMVTNVPYKIGGNVLNLGIIPNLPEIACVEVPCLVDSSGVTPTFVGNLPEVLAALNRTNINVHLLTIEAALTFKREAIYHAALLDPHTAAELSIDSIINLCDDLIEAHGDWLPKYR